MNQRKEKALERRGGRSRAREVGNRGTQLSLLYTISLSLSTSEFVALLEHGADNALPAAELQRLSGLTAREIRAQTEAARRAGVPVCTDQRGYFLASTPAEKAACVRRLRRQAETLGHSAAALERAQLPPDT